MSLVMSSSDPRAVAVNTILHSLRGDGMPYVSAAYAGYDLWPKTISPKAPGEQGNPDGHHSDNGNQFDLDTRLS